ncbi:MAG: hypothetical protein ACR2PL_18945 [Dehalococcoidia bacterium]
MSGRKSKYTPEAVEKLTHAIALGATYKLAANYAGIDYDTLRVWRETKPAFSVALKEAEGKATMGWLRKVEEAAEAGVWQAAAWKLERRYPEEYALNRQQQVRSEPHQAITIREIIVERPADMATVGETAELSETDADPVRRGGSPGIIIDR